MNYYDSIPKGFFVNSCTVTILYLESFVALVRDNKINSVFRVDADASYLVDRKISERTESGYFFCVSYNNNIYLMDPMGFLDLETLEEAKTSNSLSTISRLKHFINDGIWADDIGTIYALLNDRGYKTGDQILDAYQFFEGNFNLDYDKYLLCKKKATNAGFTSYKELCIAKEGGFVNDDDLFEAERYKAPDKKSLEAIRILLKVKRAFNFENLSESLVACVIVHLAIEKDGSEELTTPIDLPDIWYRYNHWFPEIKCDEFEKMKDQRELTHFLESPRGRALGQIDFLNQRFQFSIVRIYIDGANIAHKGRKRGETNKNLPFPSMSVLLRCYEQLKSENIGPVYIYLDDLKAKKINEFGTAGDKAVFEKLYKQKILLTTLAVETADDRILQKLKDDPFAYIVSNDDYSKDHSLTEKELNRVINVDYQSEKFRFYGKGYESSKAHASLFAMLKDNLWTLYHAKELGYWPFTEEWYKSRHSVQGCC